MERGHRGNRGNGRGGQCRGRPWRGQNNNSRGAASPRGRGRGGYSKPVYTKMDEIEIDIQQYADVSTGYNSPGQNIPPRGRGRGQNNFGGNTPVPRSSTPSLPWRGGGSGRSTPRGRGSSRGNTRGRGAGFNRDAPLSKLLDSDRPFLRPVIFVRAEQTPATLFQGEEEILVAVEVKESTNHVPTAERVAKVFKNPHVEDSFFQASHNVMDDMFAASDSEPVVTIDFKSLKSLVVDENPKITLNAPPIVQPARDSLEATGEIMESLSIVDSCQKIEDDGLLVSASETTGPKNIPGILKSTQSSPPSARAASSPIFVLDPNPTRPGDNLSACTPKTGISFSDIQLPLGSSVPQLDEVIVYVAPHPRTGRSTPFPTGDVETTRTEERLEEVVGTAPAPAARTVAPIPSAGPSFNSSSFSFAPVARVTAHNRILTKSPRKGRLTKKDRRALQRRSLFSGRGGFAGYGALREELQLHEDDEASDSRVNRRRHGSDIDWGEDSGKESPKNNGEEEDDSDGMKIDSDIDLQALSAFAKGMSEEGMRQTTISDIAEIERMRLEDEEESASEAGSSRGDDEITEILRQEEEGLQGAGAEPIFARIDDSDDAEDGEQNEEDEEDEEDDSDSDLDEEESPRGNFQARLARARQNAKGKGKEGDFFVEKSSSDGEEDQDDYDEFDRSFTWADKDEMYQNEIQRVLQGRNRKQSKAAFESVFDGDFSVQPINSKTKAANAKYLPPELREQWEKDRARKAENKRKRAELRLAAAADPRVQHKKGKKGRKAMMRAAAMADNDSDADLPNQIVNYASLISQIRAHVADLGGPRSMALPPMDREARKRVHEIAHVFGLKSVSKGKGKERYTTLEKTTRTGLNVNEGKIARITKSGGKWGFSRPGNQGGSGQGGPRAPRHRDGDEVGKAAPKISESNIGFKMLATMGWVDGESIGLSGGLEVPLKAIIKNTKLGLGAMTRT